MGKLTAVAVLGLIGLIGSVSAMQSLGSDIEYEAPKSNFEVAPAVSEPEVEPGAKATVVQLPDDAQLTSVSGSTMLEQAILDAFPSTKPRSAEGKKKAADAADFVAVAIISKGFLCAQPMEMRKAAEGQYGIGCVKYRTGGDAAIYLVDSRTGSVAEI